MENAENYDLSESSKKLVVDVIARYHLSLKRRATIDIIDEYAQVVTKVFKKEKKVMFSDNVTLINNNNL